MEQLFPFILFIFSTAITPGPNNLMLLNSGLNFGFYKTLPHFLGVCIGFPLMIISVAAGLGAVFEKYIWLKEILKIIGSLYMLYLAWHMIRSSKQATISDTRKPMRFIHALLFQWVNPKTWLMAIGAVSIFTFSSNNLLNAVTIGLAYLIVWVPCGGAWTALGNSMQKWLSESKHLFIFNVSMAFLLVLSVILMLLDK